MSALLTLTRREIVERGPMLWGTLAAALIPLLARIQPWLRPELRREWHEGLALVFAITFPVALAIGLGASVVGEDLANRRLGFYFSRPISAWTIWASKNLAAILITLGTFAAFALPVALLSDGRPSAVLGDLVRKFPEWFLPWIVILVGLIFVAQAVAGAYRAKDGIFALDIVALATLVSLGAALVWRLRAAGVVFSPHMGPTTIERGVAPAMLFVAAAAGVAAAMQVIVGRTDARRGHLALSATLWGTLATGLLCAAGFISWVLAVSPQEAGAYPWSLRATASASHLNFWAARSRGGAGYQPAFLLETSTGRFDRLPMNRLRGFIFSREGSRAVWVEGAEGEVAMLVLRRLDGQGGTIRSILDRYAGLDPVLSQLSDDGRRAVLSMKGRIAVVDTDSGREAASASLEQLGLGPESPVQRSGYAFVGDAVVGFFPPASLGQALVVATFDFRTGQVAAGPKVEGVNLVRGVRDGRALVSGRGGRLTLVDGAAVHPLVPDGGGVVGSATLLDDGRVAASVNRGGDRRLMLWNPDGQPALDVPFPAGSSMVAGEPRAGWLALGADYSQPPKTVLVDSHTGAVVRVEEGLTPIGQGFENRNLPAGSRGSQLFVGTKGEVVHLDPDTGQREAIFVPTAPEGAR